MTKKIVLKTSENDANVDDYIDSLPSKDSSQAKQLDQLFRKTSGLAPKMWGGSIIGYGKYIYHRANGDEGEMLATGFAMRKSGPVLYILPGYKKAKPLLDELGPHKLGKSCLYIKRLSDVDLGVVEQLISAGLQELKAKYDVDY